MSPADEPNKPAHTRPTGEQGANAERSAQSDANQPWLDRASTHNRIFYALLAVCAVLLGSDLVYHKHAHFGYELWFGFYAGFGFLAYCSIVFTAKLLRRIVKRKEDYYD